MTDAAVAVHSGARERGGVARGGVGAAADDAGGRPSELVCSTATKTLHLRACKVKMRTIGSRHAGIAGRGARSVQDGKKIVAALIV
jgi:hypothetical protein